MTLLIKMGGGFQHAFSTRCWYCFFHKPLVMGVDWNMRTAECLLHAVQAEGHLSLCAAQEVPLAFRSFCQAKKGFTRMATGVTQGNRPRLSADTITYLPIAVLLLYFLSCSIQTSCPHSIYAAPRIIQQQRSQGSQEVCIPSLLAAFAISYSQITGKYNVT